jgi:hypothetical protein
MLKRPAMLCASLLFAAVLVLGLVRLFELRFDRGDIYPPYSTLRTDPLGASVLYESLDGVPGVSAQRYFEDTFKSDDGRAHALFVLGAQADSIDELSRSEFDTIQRFVFNGGRVVIAYYPQVSDWRPAPKADTNVTEQASGSGKRSRHHHHQPEADADGSQSETNRAGHPDGVARTNSVQATNVASKTWRLSPRHARRHQNSPDDQGQQDQSDQQEEDELKAELLKYANVPK